MDRKPIYNALMASGYIVGIVLLINLFSSLPTKSDNAILIPIVMLSLLTLSVAVMGYLFGLQPIKLYLDGKKEEAVKLFLRTIAIFAGITFVIVAIYLLITYIF
jgi:uncharacterized membrane protein